MRIACLVLVALVHLPFVTGPASAIGLTEISNPATAGWVDTGISATALGNPLWMAAAGSATPTGVANVSGPDGDLGPCGTCIEPLPNSRYALADRVGSASGTGFLVASSDLGVATKFGNPLLGFEHAFHGDESGKFLGPRTVVPQPETGLLLASGLLGLVVVRRFPAAYGAMA
jgi:hypothetical protein